MRCVKENCSHPPPVGGGAAREPHCVRDNSPRRPTHSFQSLAAQPCHSIRRTDTVLAWAADPCDQPNALAWPARYCCCCCCCFCFLLLLLLLTLLCAFRCLRLLARSWPAGWRLDGRMGGCHPPSIKSMWSDDAGYTAAALSLLAR